MNPACLLLLQAAAVLADPHQKAHQKPQLPSLLHKRCLSLSLPKHLDYFSIATIICADCKHSRNHLDCRQRHRDQSKLALSAGRGRALHYYSFDHQDGKSFNCCLTEQAGVLGRKVADGIDEQHPPIPSRSPLLKGSWRSHVRFHLRCQVRDCFKGRRR